MPEKFNDSPDTPRRGWVMLAILLLANILAFIDRSIINLIVDPMKRDLGLSDIRISLLQGFAFALLLSFSAIPVGRLVDRTNRVRLLAIGVVFWSIATAGCGIVKSFEALLLCRICVGIGEAVMTPTAYSLIGDRFPRARQGIATAIYGLGSYFGAGLALVLGGALVKALPPQTLMPVAGLLHGWQLLFLMLFGPGLITAILVWNLYEPGRGPGVEMTTISAAVDWHRRRLNVLVPVIIAMAFGALAIYALLAWIPTYFHRRFDMPLHEVGRTLGLIVVAAGTAGTVTAGFLGDWAAARWRFGRLCVFAGGAGCAAPFFAANPFASNSFLAFALLVPGIFFITMAVGAGPASLQDITPPRMRGMLHACAGLTITSIGLGLGPTSVALITDLLLKNESEVGISLAITLITASSIACLSMGIAMRPYAALREAENNNLAII